MSEGTKPGVPGIKKKNSRSARKNGDTWDIIGRDGKTVEKTGLTLQQVEEELRKDDAGKK